MLVPVVVFAAILCNFSWIQRNVLFVGAFQPRAKHFLSVRSSCRYDPFGMSGSREIFRTPLCTDINVKYRSKDVFQLCSTTSKGIKVDEISGKMEKVNSQQTTSAPSEKGSIFNLTNTQLLMNAALLAVSFGFALFTILKVDAGMTRGWTNAEIMMRIPIDNWKTYEYNLEDNPIETKTFINVIIYLLGDWLSQTVFKKQNVLEFDAMQTLKNGFIGLCFGPLVHQYYEFSDYILPVDVTINRLYKILMDQTLYLAVKCSIYIVAVGMLRGDTWEESIQSVKERITGVMVTAWKFWPLVHCVTYGLIPARHRILWVNCVDLVWNAILASKARENSNEIPEHHAHPNAEENEKIMAGTSITETSEIREGEEFVRDVPVESVGKILTLEHSHEILVGSFGSFTEDSAFTTENRLELSTLSHELGNLQQIGSYSGSNRTEVLAL